MKKIVVTTTFRSFMGDKNDRLQRSFLRSLKKQTYQNFILVVTIYREKNIEQNVKAVLGDKAVFVYTEISEEYRYSPTKVVLNGIEYGEKNGYDILVDCSGDITLQDNALETVARYYSPMYTGISHPNIFYEIDDQFHVLAKSVGSWGGGIDFRFFDIRLLNHPDVKKRLEKYALYDWGGIEHLLYGICQPYANEMINIFEESKVIKVKNDRDAANEDSQYIQRSGEKNREKLKELACDIGIDFADFLNLLYIHMQYRVTKNRIRNFIHFKKEWKVWIDQRLMRKGGYFNKILAMLIHWIL